MIEDPESIGAMTRVSSSAQSFNGANGGTVYGYPEQEFKLKAGDGAVEIRPDQVRENTSILWIDEDRQLVEMGFKSGEIPPDKVIEAVANLDNSTVFIQGPPGTGKTYTGSHIIAELIRRGFQVGVSLANLVTMGLSARNIVLLGDQMQLGQPMQGSHPGRSGESTLEYLLDGAATITPERGIFLDTTWRMHKDLCGFISDAVYDSRLKAQAMNQNQTLLLDRSAHPCLKATGLSFVPIDHGRVFAEERGGDPADQGHYREPAQTTLPGRNGNEYSLTLQNIMIVAPYNMQVNLLLLSINCNTIEQMELVNTLC